MMLNGRELRAKGPAEEENNICASTDSRHMTQNVLLIILDSVRARNMSLYGHPNETTPFLESFAEESIVYTQARSPSVDSRPSHASVFTGLHAAEHNLGTDSNLVPGVTIWEKLRDEFGYETGVFSSNPFLLPNSFGLTRGFDKILTGANTSSLPFSEGFDPRGPAGPSSIMEGTRDALSHEHPIKSLINGVSVELNRRWLEILPNTDSSADYFSNKFIAWVDDLPERQNWAACLNLMDAHYPYSPTPEFDHWGSPELYKIQSEWAEDHYRPDTFTDGKKPWWQLEALRSLYDGAIRKMDSILSEIIESLIQRGEYDDTYIIITSDHGEGFGEVGYFESKRIVQHGASAGIHNLKCHVPLLIKPPGSSFDSRVVTEPASLTEFYNSVHSFLKGKLSVDEFVPEDEVLVSVERQRGKPCIATFEEGKYGVEMLSRWGENEEKIHVMNAQSSCRDPHYSESQLDGLWDDLEDKNVCDHNTELSAGVEGRLDDLGYI